MPRCGVRLIQSPPLTHIARHASAAALPAPPLSAEPSIHPEAEIRDCWLGAYTAVGARTSMAESRMDAYSYVVNDADIIYAHIGKFCSIAAKTRINPGNHPTWRASQHHFIYRAAAYGLGKDETGFFDWRRGHRVTIGHDVWIGHGATILPGRKIGNGAVVGAGAVVAHDVEPYAVVAGVPAKPIKRRFDQPIAEALMALAWWDWSHDKLRSSLEDFRNLSIEAFLEKHGT